MLDLLKLGCDLCFGWMHLINLKGHFYHPTSLFLLPFDNRNGSHSDFKPDLLEGTQQKHRKGQKHGETRDILSVGIEIMQNLPSKPG